MSQLFVKDLESLFDKRGCRVRSCEFFDRELALGPKNGSVVVIVVVLCRHLVKFTFEWFQLCLKVTFCFVSHCQNDLELFKDEISFLLF